MIHEVQMGRQCDTLRHQLEETLAAAMVTIDKSDTVIKKQQEQISLRDEAVRVQTERILNQQKEKQELKKEIRRQKALTIAVAVASVLAIIIIL
jgi:hypothetical protein